MNQLIFINITVTKKEAIFYKKDIIILSMILYFPPFNSLSLNELIYMAVVIDVQF